MYMDWWNGGRREGPAWASYHLDVLRQTSEDRYNIRPGRRWHAIGGISMGGQGALRYAALLPGYFGSVAALSAAMPDTQAVEFQGGLDLVDAMTGPVGESSAPLYVPAQAPYAAGNRTRALVGHPDHP